MIRNKLKWIKRRLFWKLLRKPCWACSLVLSEYEILPIICKDCGRDDSEKYKDVPLVRLQLIEIDGQWITDPIEGEEIFYYG